MLAPGGRLLSLDFNRPAKPLLRAAYLLYLTVVGSTLGLVLHRDPDTYRYIPESIRNYPGAAGVARLLERRRLHGCSGRPAAWWIDGDSCSDQVRLKVDLPFQPGLQRHQKREDVGFGEFLRRAPALIGRSSSSVRDPRVWRMRPTTTGGRRCVERELDVVVSLRSEASRRPPLGVETVKG